MASTTQYDDDDDIREATYRLANTARGTEDSHLAVCRCGLRKQTGRSRHADSLGRGTKSSTSEHDGRS